MAKGDREANGHGNLGPGAALRLVRQANGWTLTDVTRKTGVPVSTVSRIENGIVSPTYDILLRLSRGLGLDLADLLTGKVAAARSESAQSGRRSVNRAGDGEPIDLGNPTLRYLSTDLLGKLLTPIVSEYRARSLEEFGEMMRHPGEEYLYVLDGVLELHTECYAPIALAKGDSIYFDSRMGHAYIARTTPCRALSICAAPHEAEVSHGERQTDLRIVETPPARHPRVQRASA